MYKVSVIVPVYNTEKYLKKCIDSLVQQDLKEIEIIVVNDGSTDGCQKIIDEYVKSYPEKVKSYYQNNSGQAAARNNGIAHATGEYIAFVDSDDYIQKNAYNEVYRYAKEENLDIVCFDFYEIHKNETRKSSYYSEFSEVEKSKRYVLLETSPWNKIIKKSLIDRNNIMFTENHIYEDLELIPTLALYTDKIGFMRECYYNYVIRDNSTMRKKKYDDKLKNIYPVMENLYERLSDRYSEELEYLYIEHLLHGASMRFIEFEESTCEINNIAKIMHEKFPRWKKNCYYKKKSIKYKIICNLIYRKNIRILKKILKKGV